MASVMLNTSETFLSEVVAPDVTPRSLDLSLLIVTWNSERWIERCLRSVAAACEGLDYEVVIHDNASTDATLDRVPSSGNVHVLRSGDNTGFAAGTNRAFSMSRGRYVFLLNPDCELEPRALTSLYQFLESHPRAAAAAPLLEDESGDSQREFQLRRLPTMWNLATEVLLIDKLFPKNAATARYRYRDLDLTEPRRIEQPAGAALLIRRDVFERVGPLDEQFAPAWFEDVDYCRRLAAHGEEIWVVPTARVRHFGGSSRENLSFARFADIWYGNMWRYARKHFRPAQAEALRWAIIGGMLLRYAAGMAGKWPRGVQRRDAFQAYRTVLGRAFDRWDGSSPSSS
jgi:N-acetylglucosaminyl-diphospho-decaprenol L-rhamnosyltransferase